MNKNTNEFSETVPGDLGMHVEVKDPDSKIVLSRVRSLGLRLLMEIGYILVLPVYLWVLVSYCLCKLRNVFFFFFTAGLFKWVCSLCWSCCLV